MEETKDPVVIAGRTFRPATVTTVAQDVYTTKRLRASGLATLSNGFNPATDDVSALSERMLFDAFESGVLFEILAGALVEDGVRWTRDVAAANAQFFANLTDAADKEALYSRVGQVVFDFLVVAALSRETFPNFLGRPDRGQPASDGHASAEAATELRPPSAE